MTSELLKEVDEIINDLVYWADTSGEAEALVNLIKRLADALKEQTMTNELKLCPFCGQKHEDTHAYQPAYCNYWRVICGNCGSISPTAASEEDAIKAWNTRHISDEMVGRGAEAISRELQSYDNDVLVAMWGKNLMPLAKAALTAALKGE